MRYILFRGKRIDNGEWIRGYLWIGADHTFITPYNLGIDFKDEVQRISAVAYEVLPTTIGQYTNLEDKTGKRLYEGDIVHLYGDKNNSNICCINYNALVVFRDGGFCAIDGTPDNNSLRRYNFVSGELNCEKIGNIHDNPELLKETSDNE